MTTLTTMLGVIPMAMSHGEGAEIYAPLGQAIAGGLITSTMITLFIIPILYFMTEKKKEKRTLKELIEHTTKIYKEDNERTRKFWQDIVNDTKIDSKQKAKKEPVLEKKTSVKKDTEKKHSEKKLKSEKKKNAPKKKEQKNDNETKETTKNDSMEDTNEK